jgi:glycosyltransferase involved in cell wall biosynthesis
VEDVLKRLNAVVYISEEQRLFFEEKFSGINLRLYKVYNGYQPSGVHRMLSKQDVGIEPGAFVFGMVARGIPEKGWAEVIESFNRLQLPNSCLLLVGDSDYVRSLKEKHASNRQIIFAGYSSNPVEYIKLFDVGLFASTYASESLPTVLIEYLNCGVPVVSVAIAECKNMLQSDTGAAGLLVELEHGKVPVELFKNAMLAIALDTDLYNQLQQNTAAAFKKFNMQACVEAYEKVYSNALCSRLNHRQSPRPAE